MLPTDSMSPYLPIPLIVARAKGDLLGIGLEVPAMWASVGAKDFPRAETVPRL